MSDEATPAKDPVEKISPDDLVDPEALKRYAADGTREMIVLLRLVMRGARAAMASGTTGARREFLDAAKLWERLIISKPTGSRGGGQQRSQEE